MQHLGVNFGGIWRFELGFLSEVFWVFLLKKPGLIFKSPVATLPPTPQLTYATWSIRVSCNYNSHKYSVKWPKIGVNVGICLGNYHDNFHLYRFIISENIAKV